MNANCCIGAEQNNSYAIEKSGSENMYLETYPIQNQVEEQQTIR